LDRLFREVVLPGAILSDKGPPFGSREIAGFSRLGVWLPKLEVQPIFTLLGMPEQNERHERFHETVKAEKARPPRSTVRAQQVAIDSLTDCYNGERPHEALDMRTPEDGYRSTTRAIPSRLSDF